MGFVIVLNPLGLLVFSLATSGRPCNDDIYGYLFRNDHTQKIIKIVSRDFESLQMMDLKGTVSRYVRPL